MKINTIRLANLNSLRGEKVLHFDTPPLSSSGLFAITGDTGAGKSTILDALTLALYGQVPRQAQEGENMSYGTGKSLAEVEFEVGKDRYRCKWSIWRAREKAEGNLQGSKRELSRWNAEQQAFEIIGEKKREVTDLVAEITGLDYDRFCRSVLLSQGDFAAFLKANERDRSALLERITGTAIYSELSIAAFERHKLEKQALEALEKDLERLELLSAEDAEALDQQLRELKGAVEEKQKEEKRLREQLNWVQELEKLQQKETDLKYDAERLREEALAFRPLEAQLELHQKALPVQLPLQRARDVQRELETLEQQIAEAEQNMPSLQQMVEAAKQANSDSAQALKRLKTERQQQAPVLDQVKALDLKITGLQAQQEKQQAVLLTARQALEDTLKEITAVGLKLATAEKEAEAVTVWMEQNSNWAALAEDLPSIREQRQQLIESFQEEKQAREELSQKQNARKEQAAKLETSEKEVAALSAQLQATKSALAELAPKSFASTPNDLLGIVLEEIADLSNRQQQLKQLQGFSQQYEKLLAVQDQLEAELEQLQTRDRLLNTQVLGTVDQLDELQRTRAYRNEIYEQQQRIANYEKDRSTLKEGDPCPLCLSTTHPFRENGIKPFVDEAKAELKRVEGKIEGVQQHQRQLLKEQQEIELRIQQLQGDEKATIAGQIQKQLQQLIGYEEQISVIRPEEGQWEKADSLNAEIGQLQDQLQQREKDRKEIGQLVKRLNEQEVRFNKTERSHQDTAAEQRVLDHSITHLTEEQQKKKKKFEQGTARINQLLARYNFTFELDTAKQMFKSLEERRAQWAEKNEQSVTLSKSIALLQSQMKQLSRQEEERKASLVLEEKNGAETGAELNQLNEERKALFGDQDPELVAQALRQSIEAAEQKREHSQKAESDALQSLITAQSQLEEKSARQASQKGRLKELQVKLDNAVKAAGFKSTKAVEQALLPEEEANVLTLQSEQLRLQMHQNEQGLSAVQSELEKTKSLALTKEPAAFLETQLNENVAEATALQQQIGALTEQQRQHQVQQARAKGLTEQLDIQRNGYRRWAELNDIIGQADGKKFRMFAQGLTLQKLAQLANRHLQQLHGRYLIHKQSGDTLELDIVDTYQADNRRSMNTLSGGESFLVSLALALGLSELSGRHASIQSLFIDEGFGTLDENTLDLAIATLENLQASGKTIGIISHVKALKERIGTQVQVLKQGNGFSTIQVVG